jgi:hypothetical protein
MPPLQKWRDAILDDGTCWGNLRGQATPEEAAAICAWEGWHPILRAQMEMFFGLKGRVEFRA